MIDAAEIEPLQHIREVARAFVAAQYGDEKGEVEIVPGKLDPRLRMPKCDQDLDAEYSASSSRGGSLTVNIRCNGIKPWSIYVPVQVKVMQNVVVLAHSVQRNRIIRRSDVRVEKRDINRMHSGYFTDPKEVIGKKLKRSVGSGLALSPVYVESPLLVKRGQKVVLVAELSGITVKMAGKAMSNGAAGERVKVKNLSSNRVVEGLVTDSGIIRTN